ncbi:MAG: tetraacyldisaccharide 4'-kinase [Succinivibrio sp.]|nr:tetraacyldisaccharide 4'-kinase [Succinivibrio sp.]
MSFVDSLWYGKRPWSLLLCGILLLPASWLFGAVSSLRRVLYLKGLKPTDAPDVPVIVVGGITVGGSGKTPLCIALLKELKQQGYHPALISRGYRGEAPAYPFLVEEHSDPKLCGDESLLIKRSVGADIPVAVDPDRVRGAFYLASLGADVIVCDDGMQHYALERDVEIAVIDLKRGLGNGQWLPAGPLREKPWRLECVDAVVFNGAGMVNPGYYTMVLRAHLPRALTGVEGKTLPRGTEVCALAGIGNPGRFYETLRDLGFEVTQTLKVPDHGRLDDEVIIKAAAVHPVVMTAKDAVKYGTLGCDNVYVVEVAAQLSDNFYGVVLEKLRTSRNKIDLRAKRHAQNAAQPEA